MQLPCGEGTLVDTPPGQLAEDRAGGQQYCADAAVTFCYGSCTPPYTLCGSAATMCEGFATSPGGCCHALTALDMCQTSYGTVPCYGASTGVPHCQGFSQCGFFATPPRCGASAPHCHHFHSRYPCIYDSHTGDTCYFDTQLHCVVPASDTSTRMFVPEQLPLLRRQLEEQLEQIEAARQTATERVEAQLKELERAEAALRDHDAAQDDTRGAGE